MVVQSRRLGPLEVDEQDIIRFPQGLPGFSDEKAFALLPYGPQSPFAFLQSTIESNLTFLVVDPFAFFADYQFELADDIALALGVSNEVPPQIFAIVSVPADSEKMTANLLAPIILNPQNRLAVQVVLDKTPFTTRHRLFPEGFPQKPAKGAE